MHYLSFLAASVQLEIFLQFYMYTNYPEK